MSNNGSWLLELTHDTVATATVDGLIPVAGYDRWEKAPEEVAVMEKAASYGAQAVFFEAGRNGRAPVPQAFIFISHNDTDDASFATLHKRLWSWGGVPLIYRKTLGVVQLFRCAHNPDFVSASGEIICKPFKILKSAADISRDPWWDAERLRNGTLWDDPEVCHEVLSAQKAAHKRLVDAVKALSKDLNEQRVLPERLRRRLLILSLLIAYLEERQVLLPDYFAKFKKGATKFFEVLANGDALITLLADLEDRFNGNVFTLALNDKQTLSGTGQLSRFARLVEGRQELNGQLTLWQLYSFRDLPVELISHIYQLFVKDVDSSVYTPPFLVRLMLDEALSWEKLDRLSQTNEVILDPCCGSGVFLVEAYKRLVLHWRSRNEWKRPGQRVLKMLLGRVHGVDLEEGAVELAAFSLCLALCDALEPETIRASIKLFPVLAGKTLHHSCFFEAKDTGVVAQPVGVVTGNPPFTSTLNTPGAVRSYERYQHSHGSLPDKQLAYLFLHESMELLVPGGTLSLLQQYNFLYNQQSLSFRRKFVERWDVREILDFVSVRGLFQKGKADTKVIVVLAESNTPTGDRRILHATFRRSGRIDAEQGFDIDYYDLHWLPRELALTEDDVWRSDLLGGGRVLGLVNRLRTHRTLGEYATARGWDHGEGFIEGQSGKRQPAKHLTGKPLVPSEAIVGSKIDRAQLTTVRARLFKTAYTEARYMPPMLLIREHMNLDHAFWTESYLTYKNKVVGICAPSKETKELKALSQWFGANHRVLRAFAAAISVRMFTQKATTLSEIDILSLPYSEHEGLDLSENEHIIIDDIADYYSDLVRLGESSLAMSEAKQDAIAAYGKVLTKQINAIYKRNSLKALRPYTWPGITCVPFSFGGTEVDWKDAEALQGKLDALLKEQRGSSLWVSRIARLYDKNCVFLVKPNRLRYWLRSTALRDADEVLADLRAQGF